MPAFDDLILTAANERQAAGYRAHIAARRARGGLPDATRFHVIPDPGGRRVGSGGATIHALCQIAAAGAAPPFGTLAEPFADRRILICHSGGDARRLPAYAAEGKAFTPLPTAAPDGAPAALLDLLIDNLARIPAPPGGGLLVASGDVLLNFDLERLDLAGAGVVGVGYPASLARGAGHGVYVADPPAEGGRCPVDGFLQKPDAETARAHGAVDALGRVLVDTGLLRFDPPTLARLLEAAGVRLVDGELAADAGLARMLAAGELADLDVYREILYALDPGTDAAGYARRVAAADAPDERARALAPLYDALHGTPFSVSVLPWCEFFHVGSSRELIGGIAALNHTAAAYGFRNPFNAHLAPGSSAEGAFIYNATIREGLRAGRATVVEATDAASPVTLEGENVLVGLPPGVAAPVELPRGLGLVALPVGEADWATVVFGVDDDFKTDLEAGGTFLNRDAREALADRGLGLDDVLDPDAPRTLWDARLFPVGPPDDAFARARWMTRPAERPPDAWRRSERWSLRGIVARVNHERLIAHRREIDRRVFLLVLDERLRADDRLAAETVLDAIVTEEDARIAASRIERARAAADGPLFRARMSRLAERIALNWPAAFAGSASDLAPADHRARALADVARSVTDRIELPAEPRPTAILPDQVVWVTTPVRVDLAGGWSDTPPICTERGGAVVNAAIILNGQYPVQVMAKRNADRCLRLTSIDLGARVELRETADVLAPAGPEDWTLLPRAALRLAGAAPSDPASALAPWLDALGGGLDLTVFSALPKGSGLGTSSILGAALLAALGRVLDREPTAVELFERTSALEQLMGTGGGWQDQVGGIVPGVKLIRTEPGPAQTPLLQWAPFAGEASAALRERLVMYYTGQKRLAADILGNVVGRYLDRHAATLAAVDELKDLAGETKDALDRRDLDAFGRHLARYWELKKRIDPGATNDAIESILERAAPWTDAALVPGAGGGGFVVFLAKDAEAARRIRATLGTARPNAAARFFDFAIDQRGLATTLL